MKRKSTMDLTETICEMINTKTDARVRKFGTILE